MAEDMINHPPHYMTGGIEPINVIEDWDLPYHLGNCIKYIARYRHKGGLEDLEKAEWYIHRYIENWKKLDKAAASCYTHLSGTKKGGQ